MSVSAAVVATVIISAIRCTMPAIRCTMTPWGILTTRMIPSGTTRCTPIIRTTPCSAARTTARTLPGRVAAILTLTRPVAVMAVTVDLAAATAVTAAATN